MKAIRAIWLAVAVLLPVSVAAQPFAWTVNSDDEFSADQLLRVNLATGEFQFVGALPVFLGDVEGLAFDQDGTLFAVDNASKTLVKIDVQTAQADAVANRQSNLGFLPTQTLDFGMTFSCDGQLLLVAEQTQSLYMVDTETGQARVIGESGGLGDSMTAIASYGSSVYALASGSGNLYQVDAEQGTATMISTLTGYEVTDAGLAFDDTGMLWVVLDGSGVDRNGTPFYDPSTVLRVDVLTGNAVEVSTTRSGLESLAITSTGPCTLGPGVPAQVPTLSQWAQWTMALLLMAVAGWRLRRSGVQP